MPPDLGGDRSSYGWLLKGSQPFLHFKGYKKTTTPKHSEPWLKIILRWFLLRFDDFQGLDFAICFDAEQVEAG